jgi:hypothetical protein
VYTFINLYLKYFNFHILWKVLQILCVFFWVSPRRQMLVSRRFGTLCQFHLQGLSVKMELTQGSETSAYQNLTPGRYPKEHTQYSRHGESLKSSKFYKIYIFNIPLNMTLTKNVLELLH